MARTCQSKPVAALPPVAARSAVYRPPNTSGVPAMSAVSGRLASVSTPNKPWRSVCRSELVHSHDASL